MSPRITTSGPAILLPERIAGGLAMAFHELATNATKYGALSVEKGTVALTWVLAGEPAKPFSLSTGKNRMGQLLLNRPQKALEDLSSAKA